MARVILILLSLFISSLSLAEEKDEFILFTPKKGRIRSKIIVPAQTPPTFAQANYFQIVDGNPLIKIWIEKEMTKEILESKENTKNNKTP